METMNMPLDSAGPTRLFDAGIESRPHDMFPDLHFGAFQPEAQKDSLVFAPAVNWQATGDSGLARYVHRLTRLLGASADSP